MATETEEERAAMMIPVIEEYLTECDQAGLTAEEAEAGLTDVFKAVVVRGEHVAKLRASFKTIVGGKTALGASPAFKQSDEKINR